MTKTQVKEEAQRLLMSHGQVAFNVLNDTEHNNKEELHKELDKQFRRMEKFFGFVQGSWGRGV